jgi:type I restriction enzyme S subunit
MSFPRYPKYKPSGVEWLGDVPEGWEVKRARAVGVFSSSGIDKKSVDGEQEVQMFNYLDVYKSPDKILRYSKDLMWTTAPASKVAEHSVMLDDILLTPSSETADDIGHAARVTSVPPNILYSYHILRFRKGAGFDASFVTHCFNAVPIRSYFESVCTGTTRKVLVRDDFKNAPFAFPPFAEQTAIAEFLDRETGKIDELVAEQRRLMELLKEKRQAVISHAVTKGLNPHAPMKPSGIEWLGDVPKHWEVVSLKHLVSPPITDGPHVSPTKFDDGVPFVSAEAVSQGFIDFTKIWGYVSPEDHEQFSKRYKSTRGDILMVKLGATTGTVAIVETDEEFSIWVPLAAIRAKKDIEPRFLLHVLRSDNLKRAYELNWTYGTQQTLGLRTISNLGIPLPPKVERDEIVRHIDSILPSFESLTAEAQRAIDLLQERRTALISAAVTGQIDVRQHPKN